MDVRISADELRELQADGKPVTILDIGTGHERKDWWIPGSTHVAAYEVLKAGLWGKPKAKARTVRRESERDIVAMIAETTKLGVAIRRRRIWRAICFSEAFLNAV